MGRDQLAMVGTELAKKGATVEKVCDGRIGYQPAVVHVNLEHHGTVL